MKQLILLGSALFALAGAAGAQHADNVVIVLDASGSMEKPMLGNPQVVKMDAAKQAMRDVLGTVLRETQVGLLVFSGQGHEGDWLFPLGPRDDGKLLADLAKVQPDGGTPLGAYMKKGADRLLEQRAAQNGYGSFRLLLITDGQASDEDEMNRNLPEILGRGLTLDVIGVSMARQHALATKVHSYRKADDAESLSEAISAVFAEVSRSATDGAATAEFELLQGLPDGVATGIIEALATNHDEPIGTRPARAEAFTARNRPVQNPSGSSRPSAPPLDPQGRSGRSWLLVLGSVGLVMFLAVGGGVVALIVVLSKRKSRRRRDY